MSARNCSVNDCPRPAKTRGLCVGHYTRLRRHGNVGTVPIGGDPGRPHGALSTTQVVAACDGLLTYRQLDHWTRTGVIRPSVTAAGSGSRRWFTPAEASALRRMAELAHQWDSGELFVSLVAPISSGPCVDVVCSRPVDHDGRCEYEAVR